MLDILKNSPSTYMEYISSGFTAPLPVDTHIDTFELQLVQKNTMGYVVWICHCFLFVCFGNYSMISILFSLLSFFCIWRLFVKLCEVLPCDNKYIFYALFAIPSISFWTSGILKDTVCIAALAIAISCMIDFIHHKQYTIINLILFVLSLHILLVVKDYIFAALFVGLMIWYFRYLFAERLSIKFKQLIYLGLIAYIPYFLYWNYGGIYSQVENLVVYFVQKAYGFQSWHESLSSLEDGNATGYTLGDIEFTIWGVVKKIPLAVSVALFKPLPYESFKAIILAQSFESLYILCFSIYILFKVGLMRIIKFIYTDNFLLGIFVYVFIMAFIVGFTSFNYGALARYRAPMIPFYMLMLYMILHKQKELSITA